MRKITRTVYGSLLQTSLLLGLPFTITKNSTLNEKFDIQAGVAPQNNEIPKLKYLTIGNGGHRVATGADSIPYTEPLTHRARDAALFNHIPFVLREVTNDLTLTQRAKYGLRREETHNGRNYYAYYLKRLNITDTTIAEMHHTAVVDGVSTTVPFEPTTADLNPTPPELPSTGVISSNGDYLSASAIIPIEFDASDVEELIHVAKIMYDNENMALISELGLCTGADRTVVGAGPGGASFNYTEAVAVQIAMHVTAYYPVGFTNEGFDFKLQVGKTEPLIGPNTGV